MNQAKLEKPKKQGGNIQLDKADQQNKQSRFARLFADIVAAVEVYRSLDETIALLRREGSELNIGTHFDPVVTKYANKIHEDDERIIYSI
jgi:hypothetical protein